MSSLNWYLSRFLDKLPLVTIVAWASLLGLLWVFLFLFLPSQQQLNQLQQQDVVPKVVRMEPPASSRSSQSFLAEMPEVKQVAEAVQTIFKEASSRRINIDQIVYRDEVKAGEPVLRYAIDFSLEDQYPQIKSFLTGLLAAMPYLALQDISLERDDIENTLTQAHLKFILYLEHE